MPCPDYNPLNFKDKTLKCQQAQAFFLSFYIPYTHAHTGVKEHYFLEKENFKKCLKPIPEQGF